MCRQLWRNPGLPFSNVVGGGDVGGCGRGEKPGSPRRRWLTVECNCKPLTWSVVYSEARVQLLGMLFGSAASENGVFGLAWFLSSLDGLVLTDARGRRQSQQPLFPLPNQHLSSGRPFFLFTMKPPDRDWLSEEPTRHTFTLFEGHLWVLPSAFARPDQACFGSAGRPFVYRDPHAVLRSSNRLTLRFLADTIPKSSAILLRCMMRFFQMISMLSMLWIFFHLPRKHCDVSDAITELHTWTITPSMGNKVYPGIVYNSVYYMYSGYIYSI